MEKRPVYTPAEIEEKLKAAGVQPTLQRISICRHVLCQADHPTAEEVHAWAESSLAKISLATVYNTLKTLVEAGLIREYKFSHSDKVIYDCNTEDHFHFLDEKSGRLYDVASEDLQIKIDASPKFKVKSIDVLLRGQKVRTT